MMMMRSTKIVLLLMCFVSLPSHGEVYKKGIRFVTTKSSEVNVRKGPGAKFPVEWIFVKKAEPLEVVEENEQWRFVRDVRGDVGWVHSSLLSKKRSVIINKESDCGLKKSPAYTSRTIANLSPGMRCALNKCKSDWCKITCDNYTGWIEKKNIWGIFNSAEY
jgi:SH3-like domain-containing protein